MKLRLNDLCITYNNTKRILNNINATFFSGKINLIVGKSGCGKTSLLSVIAGFNNEYTGKIEFNDKDFIPDGNFALAFQNPETLFFNSTILEEISYALTNRGLSSKDAENQALLWMDKWGINPEYYKKLNPMEVSGGEKRRIALAACTICLPDIIMLDEPLAGLDFDNQILISKLLSDLSKERCLIVVTHEPEILLYKETNVVYIDDKGCNLNLTGEEFYYKSINDPEFYPLPKWFLNNPRFSD